MLTTVLSHRQLSPGYYRIVLQPPAGTPRPRAGQFFMVHVSPSNDPLLRRPFSLHDIYDDGSFALLYRVVGKGTALLSHVQVDDTLDVLGPLGNGFETIQTGITHILVGGGIGTAPLMGLSREIKRTDPTGRVEVFLGGRGEGDLLCGGDFELLEGVTLSQATEDGSCGLRGYVTESLEAFLKGHTGPSVIYTCGPTPMMREVARIAAVHNVPCYVSMEEHMGCGMGACLGCVVPIRSGNGDEFEYKRACVEGPVFRSEEVMWGAQ
ncbi:MAG: dihydroorotate dehydrogenase electron transfer subunit [Nitrospirota bacterium]|nr:dihydroorotate dehydrogenase electron transfer subunit [Nitrospirota bacterium]